MACTDDRRVVQFLVDTLELWRVEATVEAAGAPCVAVVQVDKRAIAWIERAAVTDMTFRWIVRFAVDSLSDPTKARARPCTSLVGLLNALRSGLKVERGSALRLAAAPARGA